jgi:hypothetical protein
VVARRPEGSATDPRSKVTSAHARHQTKGNTMEKRTLLTAAAIVAVGCIAIPTGAYAANGGSWLLGRSNYETATTTVTNTYGTPLYLRAKSGYAPLKVNSTKTVTSLSADLLDGISSGSFARKTAKSGTVFSDGADGMGVVCPTGTILTGGGGFDPSATMPIGYSGPDWVEATGNFIPNSWVALGVDGTVLSSFATCVNVMGGSVTGAVTNWGSLFPAASAPQGLPSKR